MKKALDILKKILKSRIVWVLLIVVVIVIVVKVAASSKKEAEGVVSVPQTTETPLSESELYQLKLNELYGEPPEGFRWSNVGELIALGDSTKTPEDVAYSYLKALAQLEFATASKYSSSAVVPSNYNAMYKNQVAHGATQFTRSLYKECLLSLEVDGVDSVAVFDNGRYIITFNIKILDLTNKDFWLEDTDSIYSNLYAFSTGEGDTSKANQYLYDYMLDYYSSKDALKREAKIDLVLDKLSSGSYLVSSDVDLDALCRYQNGAVVSEYIWQCYTRWANQNRR